MRHDTLQRIREGHLGIKQCQRRARDTAYWPGINKDIENIIETCNVKHVKRTRANLSMHGHMARLKGSTHRQAASEEGYRRQVRSLFSSAELQDCTSGLWSVPSRIVDGSQATLKPALLHRGQLEYSDTDITGESETAIRQINQGSQTACKG